MTDAKTTLFDLAALFSKPVLFSDVRIDPSTLPPGLRAYELRHADDDICRPSTVEKHVTVNFYGTVISDTPIELTRTSHSYANYDEREYSPVGTGEFALGELGALTPEQYAKGEYEFPGIEPNAGARKNSRTNPTHRTDMSR